MASERYDEITNGQLKPIIDEIEPEVFDTNKPKRKRGRPRKNKKVTSNNIVIRKPREKFIWEGKEYNSKSEVARILLNNNESKESIARKLKITVQTVHAVYMKLKKK
jgi:hypothetical protein